MKVYFLLQVCLPHQSTRGHSLFEALYNYQVMACLSLLYDFGDEVGKAVTYLTHHHPHLRYLPWPLFYFTNRHSPPLANGGRNKNETLLPYRFGSTHIYLHPSAHAQRSKDRNKKNKNKKEINPDRESLITSDPTIGDNIGENPPITDVGERERKGYFCIFTFFYFFYLVVCC
ncbi:hypothetical protein L873DRAFT_1257720 [Choiromyces venosus 120613-1]|uniref:Uncharacterized protein n=1 Tax=Choiromyces venosus 120613-1 TaxID=1336337 RepID=A0A3N4JD65_9PEZI|nr:hypothetical protein L873DRAFT_1257720 [Choiromyces venosus 120613-1]